MYIEDLINTFSFSSIRLNRFDAPIVDSFTSQIMGGTGFTEKQSVLAIQIINRYSGKLSLVIGKDICPFLETPQYRFKIRKTITDRSIKIVDNKTIEVRFPFDEHFVSVIRKYKTSQPNESDIMWDRENTAWVFPLSESNIQFLSDLCSDCNFDYDDQFTHYVDEISAIVQNIEQYAPTLVIDNGIFTILNSPKHMPKIDTTDIVEALLQARRYGVSLWSDEIDYYLNSDQANPKIRELVNNIDAKPISLSTSDSDVDCLKTILKLMGPVLFIVPGGAELEKLERAYNILKGIGIESKNMSVLFRLPSETNRIFNDFVKKQELNGPIDAETKVVFVSGKLPKPLIKSGIKFNSIINLGFDNPHYTLKTFVKTHPNLVYFDVTKPKQGYNFGNL